MNEITSPENHRHYPGLDGLRAVAVLMVLFQHYISVPPQAVWGWTGVRIFFALSGFLITGILYDSRNADRRWSVFYARRTLRIFPLYYGILLVAVLMYPFVRWSLSSSYWLWPFYLQNFARFFWSPAQVLTGHVDHLYPTRLINPMLRLRFGHFWSLAVEEQFYLIWPFVVFAVKRRETLMKICLGVIFITPIVRLVCAFTVPATWLEFGFQERFTFVQFDALLMGAYFSLWLRGPHPNLTVFAKRALWLLALTFGITEVLCFRLHGHLLDPSIGHPVFGSIGLSCVDLWGTVLVLLAIDPSTAFSKFLQNKALRFLGKISYGFYVFHDLLHDWYVDIIRHLFPHSPNSPLTALLALISTTVLATASFYLFERPFLQLKSRFTISRRERPELSVR